MISTEPETCPERSGEKKKGGSAGERRKFKNITTQRTPCKVAAGKCPIHYPSHLMCAVNGGTVSAFYITRSDAYENQITRDVNNVKSSFAEKAKKGGCIMTIYSESCMVAMRNSKYGY